MELSTIFKIIITIMNQYYSYYCGYLRLTGVLGSGEFGTVNKGVWESPMGAMDVAVKQLQHGASEEERVMFLQEAAINGQFRHPNIVKLMGVVTTGEPVSASKIAFTHTNFTHMHAHTCVHMYAWIYIHNRQ